MILACLNAARRDSTAVQREGGCWGVVTAAGGMAMQGATATALKHPAPAVLDAHLCRCGRMKILKGLRTDWSDQEAGQALLRRFDLVPYTAAGWQRQVSGRVRIRAIGLQEGQVDDPGALEDG